MIASDCVATKLQLEFLQIFLKWWSPKFRTRRRVFQKSSTDTSDRRALQGRMCSEVTQNKPLITANLDSMAYIERAPNEILLHIMSFLLPWRTVFQTKRGIVAMPTIMTLRSVSRRFRSMVMEFDFWKDETFDFCEPLDDIEDPGDLTKTRYITNLFRDKELAEYLKDKSEWKFKHLKPFLAAVQSFPGLSHATRRIRLYKLPIGIDVALKQLSTFTSLTGLTLHLRYLSDYPYPSTDGYEYMDFSRRNEFDLELLAQSCPCLEELAVKGLWEHVGTLTQLGNLRYIAIEFNYEKDIALSSCILPLKSRATLTLLKIRYYDHISEDFDLDVINSFVHLNTLELTFFLPAICDFLAHSTLKLDSFTSSISTDFPAPQIAEVLEALTAPCLKSLTRLSISVRPGWYHDIHVNNCMMFEPIFMAITSIETLQRLRLKIGMKPSWCQRFATLKHLQTLHLFPLFVESDDTATLFAPYYRLVDGKDKILTALDSVFAGFPCKPRFTVQEDTY